MISEYILYINRRNEGQTFRLSLLLSAGRKRPSLDGGYIIHYNNTCYEKKEPEWRGTKEMARKETITRNDILKAAFELARAEGMAQISARTLAAKTGCSTQPIFRLFQNMDEVAEEVFFSAAAFFENYYASFPKVSDTPFVNMGLAYIRFAQEEPNLFRLLFLSDNRHGKSLYDLLNGSNGAIVKEINSAKMFGCANPSAMFMKMWIFINGAGTMALTGDYDLKKDETVSLLEQSYQAFLNM